MRYSLKMDIDERQEIIMTLIIPDLQEEIVLKVREKAVLDNTRAGVDSARAEKLKGISIA